MWGAGRDSPVRCRPETAQAFGGGDTCTQMGIQYAEKPIWEVVVELLHRLIGLVPACAALHRCAVVGKLECRGDQHTWVRNEYGWEDRASSQTPLGLCLPTTMHGCNVIIMAVWPSFFADSIRSHRGLIAFFRPRGLFIFAIMTSTVTISAFYLASTPCLTTHWGKDAVWWQFYIVVRPSFFEDSIGSVPACVRSCRFGGGGGPVDADAAGLLRRLHWVCVSAPAWKCPR
ncbi:uncharacterized protein LAJ45_04608 [Morchella importuna]|uniref:uncharacterized protein n=1 Tax=Morchella importuna TaxID=1174673 RepID=UPI001E8ECC2D|nr:uncharacterized protein LAJ45_04608 [Morchella importuna]KAH8151404.1 hypothetical protein LAJ45_04608 [Morchella importuna]